MSGREEAGRETVERLTRIFGRSNVSVSLPNSMAAVTVTCRMTSSGGTRAMGWGCLDLVLARDKNHIVVTAGLVVRLERAEKVGIVRGRRERKQKFVGICDQSTKLGRPLFEGLPIEVRVV